MNMIKFTIIVPVYNKANYIVDTLESLAHIQCDSYEVVLVDDGSTDQSPSLCDEYEKKYSVFRTFHLKNGGVTKAREYGVLQARGEWISFVDADDIVDVKFFEVFDKWTECNCDIIVAGQKEQGLKEYEWALWQFVRGSLSAVHQILFRKNLFSAYIFDIPREITRGEDFIMNVRLAYSTTKKVAFVAQNVYHYQLRSDGLFSTTKQTIDKLELWYKYYEQSLSEKTKNDHRLDFFNGRLLNLFNLAVINCWNYKWKRSDFYKKILKDVDDILGGRGKLPMKYWTLLYCPNFIVGMFLVGYKLKRKFVTAFL